ncbi:MAG TPA: trypsin-like serine protease [Oligoflexus sp.]|uniref:trypsin-like serine protease n=1 Tax=Oligoflexus sp. TaxID=1971216 RepID=UPI002D399456|nr:trypsin-like serine protease [Oligoflexus sp.]HYX34584.1 trypsin-like serine protease [Oligoflexus sp.]
MLISPKPGICLLPVVFLLAACGQGVDTGSHMMIQNGIQGHDNDLQSVMAIEVSSENGNWIPQCSGVYLGDRLFLTASHCFRKEAEAEILASEADLIPVDRFRIRSKDGRLHGIQRTYLETFEWGRARHGKRIFSGFIGYDLALVKLDSEPSEAPSKLISPEQTSNFTPVMAHQEILLGGYQGTTSLSYGLQPFIRYLDPAQTFLMSGTGTKEGASICGGDSGGGAFVKTDVGYALKGIISFYISRNFGVSVPEQGACEAGTYSGIVDLQKSGPAAFIARATVALQNDAETNPFILRNLVNRRSTPGQQEAEDFVSGADFTAGNQGNQAISSKLQQNVDIFSEDQTGTIYVGATEIGESLTYAVNSTFQGPAQVTLRVRNLSDKSQGRLILRTTTQSLDVKVPSGSGDWQLMSVPLKMEKVSPSYRLGFEIAGPVDFDWFAIEKK